jgi:hypothetical protein
VRWPAGGPQLVLSHAADCRRARIIG